jgi:hypothetical protein
MIYFELTAHFLEGRRERKKEKEKKKKKERKEPRKLSFHRQLSKVPSSPG